MARAFCCMSLQKGTKIIGILQTVVMSLALLVIVVSLVVLGLSYSPIKPSDKLNFSQSTFSSEHFGYAVDNSTTINHDGQVYYSQTFVTSLLQAPIIALLITAIVMCTTQLVISIRLWKGANDRNIWSCQFWVTVSVVNFVVGLFLSPVSICMLMPTAHPVIWVVMIAQYIFGAYIIWVVYAFVKELQLEQNPRVKEEAFITNKS